MAANNSNTLKLTIPYELSGLGLVRSSINSFLESQGIDKEIMWTIELCVDEALVNIIEHSLPNGRGAEIKLDCYIKEDAVEIVIEDAGEIYDSTKASLPEVKKHFKEGKSRGLGLYMMRTLMDAVEYRRIDKRNILKFVKAIPA